MAPDGLQENGFDTLVGDDLEENPKVVTRAAGQRTRELAFEPLRFQGRLKRICGETIERGLNLPGKRRVLLGGAARRPDEGVRPQEQPPHD